MTKPIAPRPPTDDHAGPVPEANQPGHHPDVEQDKPVGPPPKPSAEAIGQAPDPVTAPVTQADDDTDRGTERAGKGGHEGHHAFRFHGPAGIAAMAAGATPRTSGVELTATHLDIRFGLWHLRTPLTNVSGVQLSGPYSLLKVMGPARLSRTDRGVTFATTTEAGVCIELRDPVPAALPFGLLRHPGVTITLEDPEAFATDLEALADL